MSDNNAPLRRTRSDRMIAGVVGGFAKYLGIDPPLARVAYVILSIMSAAFPGILVYIICWVLIPEEEAPRNGTSGTDNQFSTNS